MHVDFIEYKPIKKEIKAAEEVNDTAAVRKEDVLVLFTAVEAGDDAETAKKAVAEAKDFLGRLGANRLMVYPFAHISQNLARPPDALPVLLEMEREAAAKGIEVYRSPFGWNKSLQIKVKGHPLAEMSRSYAKGDEPRRQAPPERKRALTREEALARLKKSDWGSLPETDHRIIGERLDLFSFQEPSPGMVYWHDKGLKLKNALTDFLRKELAKDGYIEVSTPTLANTNLWLVSGHSDHYKDDMFLTKLGDEEMGLKPMNCPSTFLIYKSRRWSYRELPVRYAIFDPLFRNELSGVASGLFRVKVLTQDDAHIICAEEQAEAEISKMLDLMERVYKVFNLEYKVKISTRPEESMGTDAEWERATETLVRVVKAKGLPYVVKEKEGSFYAPKIDVDIKDSLGREWQIATFQLDLQMPKRFNLTFAGADGRDHPAVVLHRAILGSLERFIGVMLEHYRGKLPMWLSPVQVKVIPVTDQSLPYARKVLAALTDAGFRAEGDFVAGTMGGKIREAQLQRIPRMVVVGEKEEKAGTIAVRDREGKTEYGVKPGAFIDDLRERVAKYE